MADKKEQVMEIIKGMTVLELHELVKELEEFFGVSAAAPVAAAAGPAAVAEAAEEKTEFNVNITSCGSNKIGVIKAVREVTTLGLKEAKDLVESLPKVVKEGAKKAEAEEIKKNAELNGIRNAFFEVGNAELVIQKWKRYKFECIFIDPPRKGCSTVFVKTITNMKIPKVVYISCNPATLTRDLEHFISNGYKIREITPVDMFPQTSHVESVTLLTLE